MFDHRAAVGIGEDIDVIGLENQVQKELNKTLVSLYLPNKFFKTFFPVISPCTPSKNKHDFRVLVNTSLKEHDQQSRRSLPILIVGNLHYDSIWPSLDSENHFFNFRTVA